MNQPNPYNKPSSSSQPIGSPDMIAKCRPNGTRVSYRDYNPLEQSWCRQQALQPHLVHTAGPLAHVWNTNQELVFLVGKAIYDPLTKEFLGCIFMHVTMDNARNALIEETKVLASITNHSQVTISRFDTTGTVAASSAWNAQHGQQEQPVLPAVQELGIGIQQDLYQHMYHMVDYSVEWDPGQVRDTYTHMMHHDTQDGYLVAVYPMPPVPDLYDPQYRPEWLVFLSVPTQDVLEPVDQLQYYVDAKVQSLVYFTLVAGLVGWSLVILVIVIVSQTLTLPLKGMNQATQAIVRNYGSNSEQGIVFNAHSNTMIAQWAPETEISQVVREFEKMVNKFSGASKMARSVQERFTELANQFSFEHEFEELYQSRQEGSFAYNYEEQGRIIINPVVSRGNPSDQPTQRQKSSTSNKQQQHRTTSGSHLLHFGPIVTCRQSHLNLEKKKSSRSIAESSKGKRWTSPLFVWICVFIVTPLLLTTVTMSVIVTVHVTDELTEVIDDGKIAYVQLEKFSLQSAVSLRANWISGQIGKATRDLHIIRRYASWLLLGALDRRDSFTELTTGAETCKTESNPSECPYLIERPCVNGLHIQEDYAYRYQQESYFAYELHDILQNGNRNVSLSFPDVSDSPETTAWASNQTLVPGFEKGSAAEGYETAYDRLRVLSAVPVFQTLYNYQREHRTVLHSAVAMEQDGMAVGFHGCEMLGSGAVAFWESTLSNRAHEMRPNLCPVGKYGYDPRCREWYDTGKQLAEQHESDLYITVPYRFADGSSVGITVTSPLSFNGKHLGQAHLEYKAAPIYNILNPNSTVLTDGGFPILIAARDDRNGANTIVGPGVEVGDAALQAIEDIILRNDQNDQNCNESECERHREEFMAILGEMKSGNTGNGAYTVRMDDGTEERMFMAYAPVMVKSCSPIDSSDFSRGVSENETAIYYLALAETEASLVAAFDQVEDDINLTIDVGIAVLSLTIVLATLAVIYISYWVAISIAQPMLYLLELIQHINE
jgi:hypothetical protein